MSEFQLPQLKSSSSAAAHSVRRCDRLLSRAIQQRNWRRYRAFLSSPTSAMSATGWLLQQFDQRSLSARLWQAIGTAMNFDDRSMSLVPRDAHHLSFWAASNLIFEHEQRVAVLREDNVVQRLRHLLQLVAQPLRYLCSSCGQCQAALSDLLLISSEGPLTVFAIPHIMQIRRVVTVKQPRRVRVTSIASTEMSWFPGYAWSPGECINCSNHLGWYIVPASNSQRMRPSTFWVLDAQSLKVERAATATATSNGN